MGPNVQDVVTRGGKLLYLYKRPGKRVIVNDFGHMMVCPTLIEATLQQNTAGMYRHVFVYSQLSDLSRWPRLHGVFPSLAQQVLCRTPCLTHAQQICT